MSGTEVPLPAGSGSFRSAVRFDRDRPVVARVASHGATRVFVVCLEVGQELAEHPAPAELALLVVEGQPSIAVANVVRDTDVGYVVVMAAGTVHSLSAGTERAIVVGVLQAPQ